MNSDVQTIASLENENARLRRKLNTPKWPFWFRATTLILVGLIVIATAIAGFIGYAISSVSAGWEDAPYFPSVHGTCDAGKVE